MKEINLLNNDVIFRNDCLDTMDKMIKVGIKVDAIITSPPYNMNLRVMEGKYISRLDWKEKESFSSKYTNYTDDMPMEEYYTFLKKVISKCLKLSDLVFFNIQMLTGNKIALFKILGHFSDKIKEIIIWDKQNSQPAMHEGILNSQFEFIIVFDKNKPYNRAFDSAKFKRGTESNIWKICRESNKFHKASFPTELVKRIIKNFIPKNAIILDPFFGSGTTGLVAYKCNRRFIGIEVDKGYVNSSIKRIKECCNSIFNKINIKRFNMFKYSEDTKIGITDLVMFWIKQCNQKYVPFEIYAYNYCKANRKYHLDCKKTHFPKPYPITVTKEMVKMFEKPKNIKDYKGEIKKGFTDFEFEKPSLFKQNKSAKTKKSKKK